MRRYTLIALTMFLLSIYLALPVFAGPCRHRAHARSDDVTRFETNGTAIGFHNVAAPIGIRANLYDQIGLDLGVGFRSRDSRDDWTLDAGLPITVKSWRGARALFRPGVTYEKCETVLRDRKTTTLSAELEGEAFLVKDFSVSAAFGVAHESVDLPGASDNATSWRSTGGEFTRVGVHLYLFR